MAELTALQRLRVTVSDPIRVVLREPVGSANESWVEFQTQMYPILTSPIKVWVGGVLQTTGYTLETEQGLITFDSAPTSGEVTCSYRWSVFSDAVLNDLLDRTATVNQAAIQVVEWLLADTNLLLKYSYGQNAVDRSSVIKGLEVLLQRLRAKIGAPSGVVLADTPDRRDLMEPFLEQPERLTDVI